MNGIHHIDVSNKWAKYSFDLFRNITLITGDSGTGKTTLFRMIADYAREGKASGVHISSDIPCVALTDSDWEHQLHGFRNSIVFVDEDARFVSSREFARSVNGSDNYFVLITRDVLHELPYSVDEIYEIQTKGKKHTLKKMYSSGKAHLYTPVPSPIRYQVLLTEDSHSGFEFYKAHTAGTSVLCKSAESNSKIYSWINKNHDKTVLVIADGAAFGSEMNRIMLMAEKFPDKIILCLPESFE